MIMTMTIIIIIYIYTVYGFKKTGDGDFPNGKIAIPHQNPGNESFNRRESFDCQAANSTSPK